MAADQKGWIHSSRFDLALFTLSPLSGLVVVLTASYWTWGQYVILAAVYLVAIPHYLSTFTFYFGDDQLSYYKTRWAAFFLGPLICIAVVFALLLSGRAALFQTGQFTWNVYHVALQSAGILNLYRWLNGGPPSERRMATLAILATSAAMAFFRLDRFPAAYDTFARLHPVLPDLLSPAAFAVAIVALARLGYAVVRRPEGIALPEGAFLLTSLLLFHPYLWVDNSELATLGMLMGHFVQYLAVVWLLHRRKYGLGALAGSASQRLLSYVSARTPRIVGTIIGAGLVVFIIDRGSVALGIPWVYQVSWNVLVIMHFYLDGLIWTFRRPYVRETIGSYLILDDHRVQSSHG